MKNTIFLLKEHAIFLKCTEEDIKNMLEAKDITTENLMKWSKLLDYDFFRLYSQHLIFYSPPGKDQNKKDQLPKTKLPLFRKNIYTKEVIDFIIELLDSGVKTKTDVMNDYKIPKTTLYKWINKYKDHEKSK